MIKYNIPFEVSKNAYSTIMNMIPGSCSGREENGKFFIKCWLMNWKPEIEDIINQYPLLTDLNTENPGMVKA